MYCKKCGSKIIDGDSFCRNCGTRINTENKITVKLSTFIICSIIIAVVISIFLYIKINDYKKIPYSFQEYDDIDIVENSNINDELSYTEYSEVAYQINLNGSYIYLDYQGYILEKTEEKADVPIIYGFKTASNDFLTIQKLCDDDISYLNTINTIIENAKELKIYDILTNIKIENDEYILYFENQKKYVYLGTNIDIKNKMLYAKNIMQNENVSGTVYVNGDLQNGFKPYFREDENAEIVDNTKIKGNSSNTNNLYAQIYTGMLYSEVCNLLGEPASTTRNTDKFITYVWTTQEGTIIIQFMNGQVYQKSIH